MANIKRGATLTGAFVAGWITGYVVYLVAILLLFVTSEAFQTLLGWLSQQNLPWGWIALIGGAVLFGLLIVSEILARLTGHKSFVQLVALAVSSFMTRRVKPRESTYETRWH